MGCCCFVFVLEKKNKQLFLVCLWGDCWGETVLYEPTKTKCEHVKGLKTCKKNLKKRSSCKRGVIFQELILDVLSVQPFSFILGFMSTNLPPPPVLIYLCHVLPLSRFILFMTSSLLTRLSSIYLHGLLSIRTFFFTSCMFSSFLSSFLPLMIRLFFVQLLQDTLASEGQVVVLECRVRGHSPLQVQWCCQGKEILDSPDFRILQKSETLSSWITLNHKPRTVYTHVLKRCFLPYLCLWWWWWWLEPRSAAEPGMLPQDHQSMTVSRKPAFMFPAVSGYTSNGLEALSGDRLSHSFDDDSITSQVEFQRTLRVRGSPWESRHTQKRNISTWTYWSPVGRSLAWLKVCLSVWVTENPWTSVCLLLNFVHLRSEQWLICLLETSIISSAQSLSLCLLEVF